MDETLQGQIRYADDVLDMHFPRVKCPICEAVGSWGSGDGAASVPLYESGGAITVAQGFPAVFRYCMNCGFVRMHAVSVVNE